MDAIKQFFRDEDGPTSVEYAVLLALIISVCAVGIALVGQETATSYSNSADDLTDAFNN